MSGSREPAGEEKGTGIRLNKLLDSNLFNQEFVPKRHKFHDAERNLTFRSPSSA